MRINRSVSELGQAATVQLADSVRRLKAQGREIIALQTGDPDFDTPAPITEAAYRAMRNGETHYAASRGLPELREAIALKCLNDNEVMLRPDSDILVTSGGVHAYYCALQTILEPGSEVLVPDPAWMTHANAVNLLGGNAVRVSAPAENRFWPTVEALEAACSDRTIALVLNSPSNPTGSVASRTYMEEVLRFAEARDIVIISDEVYEYITFGDNTHFSVASLPGAEERVIIVNSFSKTYAMTGWRIGYLTGCARFIEQALKVSQNTITNVAPFVQRAAICALTDPDVALRRDAMVAEYARRRERALEILAQSPKVGLNAATPDGAIYLFIDVRPVGLTSEELCARLLDEKNVAVVPGSVYGAEGEGFVRMTIAAPERDIEEGLVRMIQWCSENGHGR